MEASSSRNVDPAGNYTRTIPFDITLEILSLLPGRSLIRFQSVSKLWFFIIRSNDFVNSFLTRSKTRPRLLFNFNFKHLDSLKSFIFSAPEHANGHKTSLVMARHDMTISGLVYDIKSPPVDGFFCCKHGSSIAVCNPTTGQLVKLPDVYKPNGRDMYLSLGYDPVEDQFKVLCMIMIDGYNICRGIRRQEKEHFVFTLSSQQKEWRKIEPTQGVTYGMVHGGVCVDGAIYYGVGNERIFRFHVRSEKIEFIQAPKNSHITSKYCSTLINYNGKLGGVEYDHLSKMMKLWVLEDAVKHEWSNITSALAFEFRDLPCEPRLRGEIHTGEFMILYSQLHGSKPVSVFFFHNFKRHSTRKMEVEGIADDDFRRVHGFGKLTDHLFLLSFPGYVENIRFL